MALATEKNIVLLCNPRAGAGKAVETASQIGKELSQQQVEFRLYTEEWPATLQGFTDVWIIGGDGTLNYFINHYPGVQLPLAVFKGGTGNDFHWLLYGNKTLDQQLHLALNGKPRAIDIGKCNEQYFLNDIGIGFEGEVARALTGKKKRPGKSSFLATVLRKIFSYRSKQYSIRSETYSNEGKKLLIDICNGRRAGGGFHIAPEARPDDGYFDVVIAEALTPLQRLKYLPVIEKGKHLHLPFIRHFNTTEIRIESETLIQYHLDGEYHTSRSIQASIVPGQLWFRY